MGLLDWIGPIGSGIQGLLNIGSTAIANNSQKKMQREQNAFNANQADLNRQFQSREAEIARDWQEQQYNQYSSPSAMVRQYQGAGLNPALMYGSNLQSSSGSSPSPSGSAASGSTPSAFAADLTGIASAFLGLAKLKQDIGESKSRENANNAAAFAAERAGLASNAQAAYHQSLTSLTKEQVHKVREEFRLIAATASNEEYKKNILELEKEIKELQRNQDMDEASFHKEYGFYPNDSLQTAVLKIAQKKGRQFADWFASKMRQNLPNFTASVPMFNDWVKSRGF